MKLNSKKNVIKYQYSDKCLKTHMGKKKKLQRSKFAWHGSSGWSHACLSCVFSFDFYLWEQNEEE